MVHPSPQFKLRQLRPSALRDEFGILLYGRFGGLNVFLRERRETAIGLRFQIPGGSALAGGLIPPVVRLVKT
jgi:hypothetical protein